MRANEVLSLWQKKKNTWVRLQGEDIKEYNLQVAKSGIPYIGTKLPEKKKAKP